MDPHAPRPDAKRHKDVSCLLEHYGGERVWVCTTGLATEDFPWPALTVPKPRHLFLPKEFHAPAYADSHVAVMLLGVGGHEAALRAAVVPLRTRRAHHHVF